MGHTKFVDSCTVHIVAGKGGKGAIAFRREKYIPFGGPAGGDGGRGGNVFFDTDPGLSTLIDFAHIRTLHAEDGEPGGGKDCYGRKGEDLIVRVPVGTQGFDAETGELLFDLHEPRTRTLIAQGGRGGRGNKRFVTPQERAPRRADPGEEGEERTVRLELKLLADVGLLGFPNVGKSTFLSVCSAARPKIADYPFTTLIPQLGVVSLGQNASFVLADIPGLVPGAAQGVGLGLQFLKHLERTRLLLHLVSLTDDPTRDPFNDCRALHEELVQFDTALAQRPTLFALTKGDLPEVQEAYPLLRAQFAEAGMELHLVSAATGDGVSPLLQRLAREVQAQKQEESPSVEENTAV